jgi:hypothetical protein
VVCGTAPVQKRRKRSTACVTFPVLQWLRLAHKCGLPLTDCDFINTDGPTMHRFLMKAQPRNTLFTG